MFIFFQELVKEVEKTKNVVDATNIPNLYDRLENLQGQLTLCEKALAEYLETKRLAFPRFYFVSSADLLDILSNGNNPTVVCRNFCIFIVFRKCLLLTDNRSLISKKKDKFTTKENCDAKTPTTLNESSKQKYFFPLFVPLFKY